MVHALTRRRLLQATGTAALAGAMPFGSARAAGRLVVTHFGGPYAALDKLIGKPFADAGLGTVSYEQELSTAALGKMQAGVAPFDITMMSRPPALRAGRAGLSVPIARGDLTNLKDTIDGAYLGDGFGVSMLMDSITLAVNTAQAGAPIESWLDLWRPDLAGKIALPAAQVQMPSYLIALVARAIGGDYKDDKAVDEAFKRFAALKKNVRVFYGDPAQALGLVERGEVAVVPQYALRISALLRKGPGVVRANPKEGVAAAPYDLVIAKSSGDPALAKKYVDFVISKEIQTALAVNLLATPVNKTVEIPPDIAGQILTDTSRLVFHDDDYIAAKQPDWLTRWEREIQA